jgi:cytochrome P450
MQVHQLHEKYGPVVRVSPNHLTFTDLDAYKTVYGHRVAQAGSGTAHVPENPKCLTYYKSTDEIPVNILMADRDEHARLRRALSHGFSDRAMREQEPLIARYLEMLVQGIKEAGEQGRKPLDMVKWYNWITFDIIGDLTFAESFGCLEKRTTHPFVELITATVDRGAYLLALRYLRLQWAVLGVLRLLAGDPLQFLNKMLGDKVKNRLAVEKERYDLFEGLVKRREEWVSVMLPRFSCPWEVLADEPQNLGVPHLTSNAILLIAAGSETTASLLSGVTYLLLENPEAMEKLKHEVRSSFKSADEITIASASRLPYLLACLNEALRRWPPAAANLPREVHEGGETILGRFVPEKARDPRDAH